MDDRPYPGADSAWTGGGEIPGTPAIPAFVWQAPAPSAIPVLLAVPHAGRCYPDSLVSMIRNPGLATLQLEDRYVDLVAQGVADATGAALVKALAPRALIDLNRGPEDVDWGMIAAGPAAETRPDPIVPVSFQPPSRRVRSGLGLIPRRLPGQGELWRSKLDPAALTDRLNHVHRPYHACLERLLAQLAERWGAALLVDLHSMPTITQGASAGSMIVLGDRFGASCDGRLARAAFRHLADRQVRHAHNLPYAGGYVLERHAQPIGGIHALQLEIDRAAYLDAESVEPGPGLAQSIRLITGLVKVLAREVADLGRDRLDARFPAAAE